MFKKGASLNENSPISIPSFIGKHIVQEIQNLPQNSDHWVKYKAVIRKQGSKPNTYDIRIYDEWESNVKGVKVTDYAFLDTHPEFIQFSGWFDSQTKAADIKYVHPVNVKG